ncbi:hypothetical protein HC031_12295 [Planosporangium thailandense]|uniref:SWIM-type domain-containing protein n=1 Tax=Planosporangium thailandense TaxID=765197 RepID=A0ABX0XWS5_9ACTN|nr:hypothetical protein [Planosporangium thailandense]NJC70485.1 hypothetical protein [Planosporangium thailandense]
MDRDEIAITKVLHRSDVYWRNCEVFAGCSCGTPYHPCDKLRAALEGERRMDVSTRNVGR